MNGLTPHAIAERFIEPGYVGLSLNDQAILLGISRSSVYYQPKPVDAETLDIMNRIDKVHTDWPVYGARKIAKQIAKDWKKEQEEARRKGLAGAPENRVIGRKRVGSLMEDMGIAAIYPKPHLSRNTKPHPVFPYLLSGLSIVRPNQVWGTDITYIRLHGGFVYLVAFLDWYTRYVVSWQLSTTLENTFCVEAAKRGLSIAIPEIINMDQGVQCTGEEFIGCWDEERTKISMDHKGRCFDNIFTERFWRNLKYEEVYLKDYGTVREAEKSIGTYIHRYNYERLHESLGYKTPAEMYYVN